MSGISQQRFPDSRKADKEQLREQSGPNVLSTSYLPSIQEDEKVGSLNSAHPQRRRMSSGYPTIDENDRPVNVETKEIRRTRMALGVMEWASNENYSRSDMKLLIEGLAAQYGLRVIPIGVPINQKSSKDETEKPRKDQKTKAKSEYKKNPKWIELDSERTEVVSRLRETQQDSEENISLIGRLRAIEKEAKTIKMDIRGKAAS
jgi:hypothetical protein